MEYVIQGGQLLLSLSILIVLHEFGHYLPARWFNVKVEKFYLFFDYKFSLFKKKIKETEWGIGWIPLGGYVKISGMIDESMDKEQMAKPPEEWEFRSKPAWQRLIIMVGGVTVNLIVGCIIYIGLMFAYGEEVIKPEMAQDGFIVEDYFKEFGFQDGDKILKINGEKPDDVARIGIEIALNNARVFEVEHANGDIETIPLPEDVDMTMFQEGAMTAMSPRSKPLLKTKYEGDETSTHFLTGDVVKQINGTDIGYWDEFAEFIDGKPELLLTNGLQIAQINAKLNGRSTSVFDQKMSELREPRSFEAQVLRDEQLVDLTITLDSLDHFGYNIYNDKSPMISDVEYGFFESIPRGIQAGVTTLVNYVKQFKYVFTSKGASSVGGFGAIGGLFDKSWNWQSFWSNTALISIILAFMNILPIPALDGGHIMFLMYELVSGRKPNEKLMEYAQIGGMIFLLALLLFANGNDVVKWLTGS